MTKQHVIGHYLDGRVQVAFCKVCSAEGDELLENCQGFTDSPCYFQDISKKEFEEKYGNVSKSDLTPNDKITKYRILNLRNDPLS